MIPYGKWRPVAVRWNSTNSYTLLYLLPLSICDKCLKISVLQSWLRRLLWTFRISTDDDGFFNEIYIAIFVSLFLLNLDHSYTRKLSEADNSNVPVLEEYTDILQDESIFGTHVDRCWSEFVYLLNYTFMCKKTFGLNIRS